MASKNYYRKVNRESELCPCLNEYNQKFLFIIGTPGFGVIPTHFSKKARLKTRVF